MQHPDSDSAQWGAIWFAKYAFYFGFPLVALFIAFHERSGWFAGLSAYWFLAVVIFAWRAVNANVALGWRIGLVGVMLASWAFTLAWAFAPPGDTKICYDRLDKPHVWSTTINRGPDPYCDGIPLQDVELD
jgi:hypothetical protein